MAEMRNLCLPLGGSARCGYCECELTMQPEGDWACSPCRKAMARIITSEDYDAAVGQFRRFQREVAPRRGAGVRRG